MATPLPVCLLDGILLPLDAARVSPLDRGFLFGEGIYEVVPYVDGVPFRLDAHLRRLRDGLAALQIADPLDGGWQAALADLVRANGAGDLALYLQVTRGACGGRDFLPPHSAPHPTVFAFCWRIVADAASARGIAAVTLEDIRWSRCDIKSTSLAGPVLLRMQARARGADEAILLRGTRLAEGSSSAVFVVHGGTVATPPPGHERLPSVTRAVLLEVIRALGIALTEREVSAADLAAASEIWIASSTRDLLPVVELDGQRVGDGSPGDIARRVSAALAQLKRRETAIRPG